MDPVPFPPDVEGLVAPLDPGRSRVGASGAPPPGRRRPPDPPALAPVGSAATATTLRRESHADGASRPAATAAGGIAGDREAHGDGGPVGAAGDLIGDRLEAAILGLETVRHRPRTSALLVVAGLTMAAAAWWLGRSPQPAPVELAIPMAAEAGPVPSGAVSGSPASGEAATAGAAASDEPPPELIVHVTGAVARPGIVQLPAGSRVVDAVEGAGGPTDEADLHQLNLAAELADGSQIRVPAVGEVVIQPPPPAAGHGAGDSSEAGPPVEVNRADATELERLPGIGPALAAAIIEWREQHGPFQHLDDLLDVPGIGPAKLEGMADHVAL